MKVDYPSNMKKMTRIFFALLFTLTLSLRSGEVRAEIPAKTKAVLTIIGYGAAGGALLGAASMAFGTSSRAIAQGASIGLYAGIIFGGYVLLTLHNKKTGSYDDNSTYEESTDVYGEEYQDGEGGDGGSREPQGSFFNRFSVMKEQFREEAYTVDSAKQKGGRLPPIQINLINYEF